MLNIIPKKNVLYRTTIISLICVIYSFYKKLYFCSLLNLCVFFTSIKLYSKPYLNYSNIRLIDILCVLSAILYHIYISYKINYNIYIIFTLFIIIAYWINLKLIDKKDYTNSALIFIFIHIFGTINNLLLYYHYFNDNII